jgi:hypothetical protein
MRKHHKEDSSVWGSNFRKSLVRGSSPNDSSVRGSNPGGKLPFTLISKGERFIRCMDRELFLGEIENKGMFQGGVMVIGGA